MARNQVSPSRAAFAPARLEPKVAVLQAWRHYLLTGGIIAAAGALRLWPLQSLGGRLAWLTFYPAVAVAALFGGLSTGLLATILSCLTVVFFLPAVGHVPFLHDPADGMGMLIFAATSTVISGLAESMRRANVRARHAGEEAERINRELEAFCYSVAHDLRAPLRSIDGFSQAILEDGAEALDSDCKAHLERVRAAAQHMAMLIDDLLALSKVGRGELRRETVDLTRLARTVAGRLQEADKEHRVVELAVEDGLVVDGDARLLAVVMDNLLGNAWKFTSKRADAHIQVGAISEDGRPVYFVRDDGAGFDMAYADKLFGPFQRLHTAAEFPGTGIGLATVQRVVHRHRGRVWAESQVDHGTTVYFTLG